MLHVSVIALSIGSYFLIVFLLQHWLYRGNSGTHSIIDGTDQTETYVDKVGL